jgi:hypothetical protein
MVQEHHCKNPGKINVYRASFKKSMTGQFANLMPKKTFLGHLQPS